LSLQTEGKFKSRPDSGIAVSMSSGSYSSYSSSEATKEPRDDIDEACHTESSDILVDRIEKVRQALITFVLIIQYMRNLLNFYSEHRRHFRANGLSKYTTA